MEGRMRVAADRLSSLVVVSTLVIAATSRCGGESEGGSGGQSSSRSGPAAGSGTGVGTGSGTGGGSGGSGGAPAPSSLTCEPIDCGNSNGKSTPVPAGADLQAAIDGA